MKSDAAITHLEDLARSHDIEIRKGKYEGKSGMGKWKGKWVLLLDRSLSPRDRIELLADALAQVGVDCKQLPAEVQFLVRPRVRR